MMCGKVVIYQSFIIFSTLKVTCITCNSKRSTVSSILSSRNQHTTQIPSDSSATTSRDPRQAQNWLPPDWRPKRRMKLSLAKMVSQRSISPFCKNYSDKNVPTSLSNSTARIGKSSSKHSSIRTSFKMNSFQTRH